MKLIDLKLNLSLLLLLAAPAFGAKTYRLEVAPTSIPVTVEVSMDRIVRQIGNHAGIVVRDSKGNEIPSQITYDSLLVFKAPASAKRSMFKISGDKTRHEYATVCTGKVYPQRADDMAWENNLVGFRAYGPATQRHGEKAFGYDIFFKHASETPVVEDLYNAQCSGKNWHKVDSLRKIDPQLAKEFENSFTYHIDHGKGMDCFAVGATLGDGVAALVRNDSIDFAWCYDKAEVLDRGPVRFTVRLTFPERNIRGLGNVVEKRVITLDRDEYLNRCQVLFDGSMDESKVATGFMIRDDEKPVMLADEGIVAYSHPTQGNGNGRALLGVVCPGGFESTGMLQNHAVGYMISEPGEPFTYYWGFAWDHEGMPDMDTWVNHLRQKSKQR